MRQIYICAWLLVVSTATAACGGEQFTTGDRTSSKGGGGEPVGGEDSAPPEAGTAGSSSGGASSAGGTATTGGTATSGGTSGGGKSSGGQGGSGPSLEGCSTGAVKLRMLPDPSLPPDYLCDAGCGTGWLTITDARGAAAFSLFSGCGSLSCASCSQLACTAAACLPTPLTAKGSELLWTGTYLAQDACGANMMACQRPDCVPPGRYRAKACAALSAGVSDTAAGCAPKNAQVCAEAEFDFPGTSEVELILRKE